MNAYKKTHLNKIYGTFANFRIELNFSPSHIAISCVSHILRSRSMVLREQLIAQKKTTTTAAAAAAAVAIMNERREKKH